MKEKNKSTIRSSDLWFGDNYEVAVDSVNRCTHIIYIFLGYEEQDEVILRHRPHESKEDADMALKKYLENQESISSMKEIR